jgi:hypothetical protein
VAFDARVQISVHSDPLLPANCPILHDVGQAPLLAILELTALTATHQSHAHVRYNFRQAIPHQHMGTILSSTQFFCLCCHCSFATAVIVMLLSFLFSFCCCCLVRGPIIEAESSRNCFPSPKPPTPPPQSPLPPPPSLHSPHPRASPKFPGRAALQDSRLHATTPTLPSGSG